jgi:hypothetical protein
MSEGRDILKRLRHEDTRKDAFNDLKRILSENTRNVKSATLYNCIGYIASHTYYFSDAEYEEIANLAQSNNVVTIKQKANIESWIDNREDLITEREERENTGPSFVYYDGPDDPDRYLGHGEFDLDEGYQVYE